MYQEIALETRKDKNVCGVRIKRMCQVGGGDPKQEPSLMSLAFQTLSEKRAGPYVH